MARRSGKDRKPTRNKPEPSPFALAVQGFIDRYELTAEEIAVQGSLHKQRISELLNGRVKNPTPPIKGGIAAGISALIQQIVTVEEIEAKAREIAAERRPSSGEAVIRESLATLDMDPAERDRRREAELAYLRQQPESLEKRLPRPELIDRIKAALLGEEGQAGLVGAGRLGLHGMGGVGKTVLATAFANESAVRNRFDSAHFLAFGPEAEPTAKQEELAAALGDPDARFRTASEGRVHLKQRLADRRALLLLDDLWTTDQAHAFQDLGGGGCRVLATTRDRSVLAALKVAEASVIPVDLLTPEEAIDLLALRTEQKPPLIAAEIAEACGFLPLALTTVAALISGWYSWEEALDRLQRRRAKMLQHERPDAHYPHQKPFAALSLSIETLEPREQAALARCARVPENPSLPLIGLQELWRDLYTAEDGFDEDAFTDSLRLLAARALLPLEPLPEDAPAFRHEEQSRKLHDLHAEVLQTADPQLDEPAQQRQFSVGLHVIADAATHRGDFSAADAAYAESLQLDRSLADRLKNPEALRNLSVSFEKVGDAARRRGDHDDAKRAYNESLAIRRDLAERLQSPEALRDLSVSLNKIGDAAWRRGDHDDAKRAYNESLQVSRDLAERLQSPEALRDLSVSLNNVGYAARRRGDHDDARLAYDESLAIRRDLAERLQSPEALRDLSVSLNNVGDAARRRGDHGDARHSYDESLTIRRDLAEQLQTPEVLRDLSVSLNKAGYSAKRRRDHDNARQAYDESLAIRRHLAEQVQTPQALRDLSVSLNNVGDAAGMRGDYDNARRTYDESLAIRRDLAERLQTLQALRDLSVSLHKVGDAARLRGKHDDARQAYDESLAIRRNLAERSQTLQALRDLSVSLNNVGDAAGLQGDHDDARRAHDESLAIRRNLAERSQTLQALRDLSVSLNKVGDAAGLQGDHDDARRAYDESLAIRRNLAERSQTLQALRDLSVSLNKVGYAAGLRGDHDDARCAYDESLAVHRDLAECLQTPEALRDVCVSLDQMTRISLATGDLAAAHGFLAEGEGRVAGLHPLDQPEMQAAFAALRAQLDSG